MMPDGFEKMKGKLYVRVNGEATWREVEEPCRLNEILELIEEQEKRKQLKAKLEKKKVKEAKKEYHKGVWEEHIAAIFHELARAEVNFPNNKWPWSSNDFVYMTSIMMEEGGEAVREANKTREDARQINTHLTNLYDELAQTAAMCLRIMRQIKRYYEDQRFD